MYRSQNGGPIINASQTSVYPTVMGQYLFGLPRLLAVDSGLVAGTLLASTRHLLRPAAKSRMGGRTLPNFPIDVFGSDVMLRDATRGARVVLSHRRPVESQVNGAPQSRQARRQTEFPVTPAVPWVRRSESDSRTFQHFNGFILRGVQRGGTREQL